MLKLICTIFIRFGHIFNKLKFGGALALPAPPSPTLVLDEFY